MANLKCDEVYRGSGIYINIFIWGSGAAQGYITLSHTVKDSMLSSMLSTLPPNAMKTNDQ